MISLAERDFHRIEAPGNATCWIAEFHARVIFVLSGPNDYRHFPQPIPEVPTFLDGDMDRVQFEHGRVSLNRPALELSDVFGGNQFEGGVKRAARIPIAPYDPLDLKHPRRKPPIFGRGELRDLCVLNFNGWSNWINPTPIPKNEPGD
jgi:hypothetical protein